MKFFQPLTLGLLFLGAPMNLKGFDLSDVTEFKASKLPVILRSTPDFGDIVSIQMVAFGGVGLTNKSGLLSMLTETMHKGTPSYSKEDIDRILTETGAVFDISARGEAVDLSLKCLKRHLPKLLPVVSEIIRVPLFRNDEVELTRKQMIAGLKGEMEHPDGVLGLTAHKAYWKGHPYLNRPQGFLDSVASITRNDLVEILPRIFNLQNMTISVVGNFTQQEVAALFDSHFGSLPEGVKSDSPRQDPQNDTSKVFFEKFDSPTTYFIALFKAPNLQNPDYPAMSIAAQILGDRLFEEVRTKRALTYSVSAGIGNGLINSGSLYVSSTKIPEAVKVIFDEVRKIQSDLIPSKDLELQVRKFASNWYLGREQAAQQARLFLMYEVLGMGWRQSNTFIERLKTVTPDQVREVARKYLKDYTVAVVGPQEIDIRDLIPGMFPETSGGESGMGANAIGTTETAAPNAIAPGTTSPANSTKSAKPLKDKPKVESKKPVKKAAPKAKTEAPVAKPTDSSKGTATNSVTPNP